MIKVLEQAEDTQNKAVYVSSFETTQQKVLEAAEKITGEKWEVKHVSSKSLQEDGYGKINSGDFSGIMDLIKAAAFGEADLGDHSKLTPEWNEKLGLQKESFEESIKAGISGKLYNP